MRIMRGASTLSTSPHFAQGKVVSYEDFSTDRSRFLQDAKTTRGQLPEDVQAALNEQPGQDLAAIIALFHPAGTAEEAQPAEN